MEVASAIQKPHQDPDASATLNEVMSPQSREGALQIQCVPHTSLPGTSSLFSDYLYRFDRLSRFYQHDPHDLESVARAAAAVDLPEARRAEVIEALRGINGDSEALRRLAQPGTVAIVTGQQVGLFGGPAYTLYKALTAAKLAAQLTESGTPAVPVFWLATEDHDFAEIDHCWVFTQDRQPVRIASAPSSGSPLPVGPIPIAQPPVEALRDALAGLPYADDVLAWVDESYQPGRTYGEAFRELLKRVVGRFGFVYIDPMEPALRKIAAPFLARAFEQAPALSARLKQRSQELKTAGYHAQVHFEDDTSLFFALDNGKRISMRRKGTEYFHEARQIDTSALLAHPENLSPTALLRPVMQDYLLPTAAYVGGPAEIAYLAQSGVLYEELLGHAPVALPRSGFTVLDQRAAKLMAKHRVQLTDCLDGPHQLEAKIAASLIPTALEQRFAGTLASTRQLTEELKSALSEFDPTLAAALERSQAKIVYQIEKIHGKTAREAMRRESHAKAAAERLSNTIFPEKHLQERLYSFLPLLAAHGPELIDTIYEYTQRSCPDHVLLTV